MNKKGQLDNAEEFLKLFPEKLGLHQKDIKLREEYQILNKGIFFDYLSSVIKDDLFKAISNIKCSKSNLIRGKVKDIFLYESSLFFLEAKLKKANRCISERLLVNFSENLLKIENSLLSLPSDVLKQLITKVISKSDISLDFCSEKDTFFAKINISIKELELRFEEMSNSLSLKERRHVKSGIIFLKKKRELTQENRVRTISTYKKKITNLRIVLFK